MIYPNLLGTEKTNAGIRKDFLIVKAKFTKIVKSTRFANKSILAFSPGPVYLFGNFFIFLPMPRYPKIDIIKYTKKKVLTFPCSRSKYRKNPISCCGIPGQVSTVTKHPCPQISKTIRSLQTSLQISRSISFYVSRDPGTEVSFQASKVRLSNNHEYSAKEQNVHFIYGDPLTREKDKEPRRLPHGTPRRRSANLEKQPKT